MNFAGYIHIWKMFLLSTDYVWAQDPYSYNKSPMCPHPGTQFKSPYNPYCSSLLFNLLPSLHTKNSLSESWAHSQIYPPLHTHYYSFCIMVISITQSIQWTIFPSMNPGSCECIIPLSDLPALFFSFISLRGRGERDLQRKGNTPTHNPCNFPWCHTWCSHGVLGLKSEGLTWKAWVPPGELNEL